MDRNFQVRIVARGLLQSLSARRAWIEIQAILVSVVLLPESLSARRAWIEIDGFGVILTAVGRSPQGERG